MMKPGKAPDIHVGILRSEILNFRFDSAYLAEDILLEGEAEAVIRQGQIEIRQQGRVLVSAREPLFIPGDAVKGRFLISDVLIGIGFHWEQKEDQLFRGALKLIILEGEIQAINLVPVEDYLVSVISSEMSGDSSPALLKAHTIISRSWLLAQIEKQEQVARSEHNYALVHETENEYIRWYDREDHQMFHVCADDHCQRYQGITRAYNPEVVKAVKETSGELLVYEDMICDARFSKCCGGVVEEFQYCWEPVVHPYLRRVDDNPSGVGVNVADLKLESNARAFISSSPEAFCNTHDADLLRQVLNDYDQSSHDFFRWEISYKQAEIAALIREKSGLDFGDILDLIPLERGESGRLVRLKIVGSKRSLVVGKELEIRRWLSTSHLYSSAFMVEKRALKDGVPGSFFFRGAGWGHGVGLCQIGAAVMAHRGYTYQEILKHYFIDADIEKRYE